MKKILLLISTIYLLTTQSLFSENHKWYVGDYARVVSMCETSNVLEIMADLMTTDTKEDKDLADMVINKMENCGRPLSCYPLEGWSLCMLVCLKGKRQQVRLNKDYDQALVHRCCFNGF